MRKVDRFTNLANELFHLLDEKEARIHALESQLKDRQRDREAEWMSPKVFKRNRNRLPVPRLEIRCQNKDDWTRYEWVYGLFYRHQEGHYVLLPFSVSKVSGRSGPPVRNGKPQLPKVAESQIGHDMRHFELPGFVIVDNLVKELQP
jgi:hypothetical protein